MGKFTDLSGLVFGRLTVLKRDANGESLNRVKWECVCECGNLRKVDGDSLRAGRTRSCGCLQREIATKHGLRHAREYQAWCAMFNRCIPDPESIYFHRYAARGITISLPWHSFEVFYADMGPRPSRRHQLDRIDNDKGYQKENCRWALPLVNTRNRSNTLTVTFRDRTIFLVEASAITGIKYATLKRRLSKGLVERTGLFAAVKVQA